MSIWSCISIPRRCKAGTDVLVVVQSDSSTARNVGPALYQYLLENQFEQDSAPPERLGIVLYRHTSHQEPVKAYSLAGRMTRFGRRCESLFKLADHVQWEGESEPQ